MIPALLAQIGLPLLVKTVRAGLESIGHPASDAAAEALEQVDEGMRRGDITPEQVAESNRHVERIAELESARYMTAMRQVNATMRAEVLSNDRFVRRWRPTFGYAVAVTWTVQMGGVTYAVVATPEYAAEIVGALANLSVMWGIALSVLGVAVHQRSRDKALAAGEPPAPGALQSVVRKLTG